MDLVSADMIRQKLKSNYSIRYRNIAIDEGTVEIIYDETLCDVKFISEYVIMPILNKNKTITNSKMVGKEIITSASVGYIQSDDEAIFHILSGDAILIFDFLSKAIYCSAPGFHRRSLDTPPTDTIIRGPREGFNEVLQDNISAVKRRIKDPNLRFESMEIGKKSKTHAVLAYIEGNAPEKLVNLARNKINEITADYIFYIRAIEEELYMNKTTFATIGYTERPDVVASRLAEGRIAVFLDGTPVVLTMPYFFVENFHVTDDYTMDKYTAALGIILRWGAFLASVLLPGLYIALFAYHFNLVPFIFIFHMAASRAGVPFPLIVETVLMLTFFQLLREGGIRLPQPIGPTLSIVGALILGDAAVNSGLTSHITVLIVAVTSIASFLTPKISISVFYWDLIILIFSGLMGLPGFYMGFVLFVSRIASLTSCGYPYLYPLGTLKTFKYNDVIFRSDISEISQYVFAEDDVN
ncbi:spore germination protein [Lutispora thermophila]|uniref:GerA spore germination protein n=1 Tax=Lutispora thermophila DSM 19022 TaxID=1122184 RepID=A0A1M6H3K4_9FIRM|nr:spore germination protein [Lutispora thermophila]SHJ16753.1 GerA spore germination protein [Lutispora thermophila DSM 19022]